MKRRILFFCIIHLYNVYSLHAMEKEAAIITPQTTHFVVSIVLEHGIQWFNHPMICSLAVSKEYDALLRKTAVMRKNYLLQNMKNQNKDEQWHKYGTAYATIPSRIEEGYPFVVGDLLVIDRQYIGEKCVRGQWDGFQNFIPYKQKGFFNEDGDFCVYGCGGIINTKRMCYFTIVEYSLLTNGKTKALNCLTDIVSDNRLVGLKTFLEFPFLLQAFLNSSKVYMITSEIRHDNNKVFCLSGITVPENYKKHVSFFTHKNMVYTSFKDLPKEVRQTIVALYKTQKKEKEKGNNKKLLGWFKK